MHITCPLQVFFDIINKKFVTKPKLATLYKRKEEEP